MEWESWPLPPSVSEESPLSMGLPWCDDKFYVLLGAKGYLENWSNIISGCACEDDSRRD